MLTLQPGPPQVRGPLPQSSARPASHPWRAGRLRVHRGCSAAAQEMRRGFSPQREVCERDPCFSLPSLTCSLYSAHPLLGLVGMCPGSRAWGRGGTHGPVIRACQLPWQHGHPYPRGLSGFPLLPCLLGMRIFVRMLTSPSASHAPGPLLSAPAALGVQSFLSPWTWGGGEHCPPCFPDTVGGWAAAHKSSASFLAATL